MEQKYLSDDVLEQTKDFVYWKLTDEQNECFKKFGLCKECKQPFTGYSWCQSCKQPNTDSYWCQSCNAKHFQENFKNWTSGNSDVDELIQESQLNAKNAYEKLEWIEYDRFENIEYVAKGGFGTIYKAFWKEGRILSWNCETDQWHRNTGTNKVALKSLNNSKD